MCNWRGHQPATSDALFALLMQAGAGDKNFSRAERVLVTACEFWAAARNRTLSEHLGDTAIGKLRAAEDSFTTIGLANIATILRLGCIELTSTDPPASLQSVAAGIEEELSRTAEPVDELIAQFACEQTWDRLRQS